MKRHVLPLWVDAWTRMLWDAMSRTGKGYRKPSMRRTPDEDRRGDKVGLFKNKHFRGHNRRYT